MEWLYPRRRRPEWKHGWSGEISAPPLPLIAVFTIVIFLLSVSQYTTYKSQLQSTASSFQLILFLLPVLLIFILVSGLTSAGISFKAFRAHRRHQPPVGNHSITGGGGGGISGSPLGVGILVVVLLVLVSYQSSFHWKWSGPLSSRVVKDEWTRLAVLGLRPVWRYETDGCSCLLASLHDPPPPPPP